MQFNRIDCNGLIIIREQWFVTKSTFLAHLGNHWFSASWSPRFDDENLLCILTDVFRYCI